MTYKETLLFMWRLYKTARLFKYHQQCKYYRKAIKAIILQFPRKTKKTKVKFNKISRINHLCPTCKCEIELFKRGLFNCDECGQKIIKEINA